MVQRLGSILHIEYTTHTPHASLYTPRGLCRRGQPGGQPVLLTSAAIVKWRALLCAHAGLHDPRVLSSYLRSKEPQNQRKKVKVQTNRRCYSNKNNVLLWIDACCSATPSYCSWCLNSDGFDVQDGVKMVGFFVPSVFAAGRTPFDLPAPINRIMSQSLIPPPLLPPDWIYRLTCDNVSCFSLHVWGETVSCLNRPFAIR